MTSWRCCGPLRARLGVRAGLVLATSLGLAACGQLRQLDGHLHELQVLTQRARQQGAYRCAPQELAEAESQLEFAQQELRQGDRPRAREHLTLARANAHAALRLSAAACTPPRSYAPEPVRDEPTMITAQLVLRRGSTKEHAAN